MNIYKNILKKKTLKAVHEPLTPALLEEAEEIILSDQENEIAYRDGVRYVNRLCSIKTEEQTDRLTETKPRVGKPIGVLNK